MDNRRYLAHIIDYDSTHGSTFVFRRVYDAETPYMEIVYKEKEQYLIYKIDILCFEIVQDENGQNITPLTYKFENQSWSVTENTNGINLIEVYYRTFQKARRARRSEPLANSKASINDLCSKDPRIRVYIWCIIVKYLGFDYFDNCPLKMTNREFKKRYADETYEGGNVYTADYGT